MNWSLINMKALIYFEFGTEIVEFFAPVDILHRAGIETEIVSSTLSETLPSMSKVVDKANNYIHNSYDEYDVIIIPGGKLGVNKLKENRPLYEKQLKEHFLKGKLVASICAAPSILGEMGLLKDKDYTCYPGWEKEEFNGHYLNEGVVQSGNLITGRSMYYSTDFGLAILEYLLCKEKRLQIENQVKGIQ